MESFSVVSPVEADFSRGRTSSVMTPVSSQQMVPRMKPGSGVVMNCEPMMTPTEVPTIVAPP